MWQKMRILSANPNSRADQQRSLEVGEGEESEDAGEQLGGQFVDQWASSKLVHNSRLIFDGQVSPWLKLQLLPLQFVAGLTQKAEVVPWCS